MGNQWSKCSKPGSTEELFLCEILVLNERTGNLIMYSLAGIISDEFCWDKPWKTNEPRQANLCLRAFCHDKF